MDMSTAEYNALMRRLGPAIRSEVRMLGKGSAYGMAYDTVPFNPTNLLARYRSQCKLAAYALRRFAV